MILQALKDDKSVTRCSDFFVIDTKQIADIERLDLIFDQAFTRLCQRHLLFPNADGKRARLPQASLAHQAGEEMAFARTATAERGFVACRFEQWTKCLSCRNAKRGH